MHSRRLCVPVFWGLACLLSAGVSAAPGATGPGWQRISSAQGLIPVPNEGSQQTCCLVLDVDGDGVNDFVVGERTRRPSIVWYKRTADRWQRLVIDAEPLRPEAGGTVCDVDRDGDPDIIFGQDSSGNAIWWWENPRPHFSRPWKRRYIKNSGAAKHHDQTTGDFDGDGEVELVSWNQKARCLLLFDIPRDPRRDQPWPGRVIYRWQRGAEHEGFPTRPVDVDQDGQIDIVGGGRWFKHTGRGQFEQHPIDEQMRFTQCAAGQLVRGGWTEVVFSPGDANGVAQWYQWNGTAWQAHRLDYVVHGHTCEVGDVDGDGNLDIMIGEMGSPGAGDRARIIIWYGDGEGHFQQAIVAQGQGIHEGKLEDLDGDGDLDILVKPYHHNAPRIDVLLNLGRPR